MRFGKLILGVCLLMLSGVSNVVWAKHYSLFSLDYDTEWTELAPESKNSAGYNVVSLFSDFYQTMLVIYAREEGRQLSVNELQERASTITSSLKDDGFMLTKQWFSQDRQFFICKGRLNGMPMQLRVYQINSLVFIVMVAGNDIEAGSELAGEIEAFY